MTGTAPTSKKTRDPHPTKRRRLSDSENAGVRSANHPDRSESPGKISTLVQQQQQDHSTTANVTTVVADNSKDKGGEEDRGLVSSENRESPLPVNYCPRYATGNDTDSDDDSLPDDDDWDRYSTVRGKVKSLNAFEDDEQVMHSVRVSLFEFMSGGKDYRAELYNGHLYACNKEKKASPTTVGGSNGESGEAVDPPGRWFKRGTGIMKLLKHLEEGITYGTVRLTMCHEGTRTCLINHIVEEYIKVIPLSDEKNRTAYTWKVEDHANQSCSVVRHFAARFDSELAALTWKEKLEHARRDTIRARLGKDTFDTSAGNEVAACFTALSVSEANTSPAANRKRSSMAGLFTPSPQKKIVLRSTPEK